MRKIGDSVEDEHRICGVCCTLNRLEKFISGVVLNGNTHDAERVIPLRIECGIAAAPGSHIAPFLEDADHIFRDGTARIGKCPGRRNGVFSAFFFYIGELGKKVLPGDFAAVAMAFRMISDFKSHSGKFCDLLPVQVGRFPKVLCVGKLTDIKCCPEIVFFQNRSNERQMIPQGVVECEDNCFPLHFNPF